MPNGTARPIVARARVATPNAASYLVRLCRHFAHKVPASHDGTTGEAELPGGRARFEATAGALAIAIEGIDRAGIARARGIVDDHLVRFARREGLAAPAWEEDAG